MRRRGDLVVLIDFGNISCIIIITVENVVYDYSGPITA